MISDELACRHLVLAVGHSARDTYATLAARQLLMEPKPFAIGLRVEHPQGLIDRIQYGQPHPALPKADYALTYNNDTTGRSCYSFCMCPGGLVIASSSEEGMVVTNGMSNLGRDSGYANSALVVNVRPDDFRRCRSAGRGPLPAAVGTAGLRSRRPGLPRPGPEPAGLSGAGQGPRMPPATGPAVWRPT